MIDLTGPKWRIVEAALSLAQKESWREITLLDIAQEAGISLAEMREQFGSKSAILACFTHAIDDSVIAKAPKRVPGENDRDRLFEVIMNRFDAMAPHKKALKSIAAAGFADPAQIRAVLASQHWMLQAAGIGAEGGAGALRVAGLASIYAAVFRVWLGDDDPGLARSMAALDRRLRRGEAAVNRFDDACSGLAGFAKRLRSVIWRPDKSATPDAGADDSGAAERASDTGPASAPPADQPTT